MSMLQQRLSNTFTKFVDSEKASGIVLMACTGLSLLLANSSVGASYLTLWQRSVGGLSLEHWINDGLMTIFFLLIGLELERELYNGLELKKVRVPIGVIAIVYEARPNVTVDAAALCLKSGNAAVLRGSSSAERSNAVLAGIVAEAIRDAGLPEGAVGLIAGGDRAELADLATQDDYVDLIIPRGGEGLKQALKGVATVPVIYAAAGNCHVYVHADADLEMARNIAYNSKVQRPGRMSKTILLV